MRCAAAEKSAPPACLTAVNRISADRFTATKAPNPTIGLLPLRRTGDMANSIWTIEEFSCPSCGMNYTATKETHADSQSGNFKCSVCNAEVHAWSGDHHFFGWQAIKTKPPVFGRRWAQ